MAAKLRSHGHGAAGNTASAWAALIVIAALSGCGGGDRGDAARVDPAAATAVRAQAAAAPAPCAGATADGWCQVLPVGRAEIIHSVDFADARHGWMAGDNGAMLRTTDGGTTWQPVTFPSNESIRALLFVDRQRGSALLANGELWQSVDGGRAWVRDDSVPLASVTGIRAAGPARILLDGWRLDLYNTLDTAVSDDGGRSWRLSALQVRLAEANGRLWSASGTNPFVRSDDGGRSFVPEPALQARPRCGLHLATEADGWAHCVSDAELPWNQRQLLLRPGFDAAWRLGPPQLLDPPAFVVSRVDARGGVAVSGFSKVWRTDDATRDWRPVTLPPEWFVGAPLPPGSPPRTANQLPVGNFGLLDSRALWVQPLHGRGVGARPLYLSLDAGATWNPNAHPSPRLMNNLVTALTRDRSGALLLDYNWGAQLFRSKDSGSTWEELPMARIDTQRQTITDFVSFEDGSALAISVSGQLFDKPADTTAWQRRPEEQQLPGVSMLDMVQSPSVSEDFFPRALLRRQGDSTLWAVARSELFRSVDRGRSFEQIQTALPDWFLPRRVVWADAQRILLEVRSFCRYGQEPGVDACRGSLAGSSDGGRTWRMLPGRWWEWSRVHFFSASDGLRVDLKRVLRTTDGGQSWQQIFENPGTSDVPADALLAKARRDLEPVALVGIGRSRLWAIDTTRLYRSDDAGVSWVQVTLPDWQSRPVPRDTLPFLSNLGFADESNGWIAGNGGLLMATRDGGRTWRIEDAGTTQPLSAVAGTSGGDTWAGGAYNMIVMRQSPGPDQPAAMRRSGP